jgi:hypothetical protein
LDSTGFGYAQAVIVFNKVAKLQYKLTFVDKSDYCQFYDIPLHLVSLQAAGCSQLNSYAIYGSFPQRYYVIFGVRQSRNRLFYKKIFHFSCTLPSAFPFKNVKWTAVFTV